MYIITSIVLKNFTDSNIYRFCDLLLLNTEPRSGDTLLYNFKLRISADLRHQAQLITAKSFTIYRNLFETSG